MDVRWCAAGTVIRLWTLNGQLALKHTATEAVEEEIAILGMLRYLCTTWRLPDNCLQAEWASPIKGECDATLILRLHDGTFQLPRSFDHVAVCAVCHVPVTNLNAINGRRYNNDLCVVCQPHVLCDLCRICLMGMKIDDEGSERGVQEPIPVCLRCIREEELTQAAPRPLWLHKLRRRCLGLEDREYVSVWENEVRLPEVRWRRGGRHETMA